MTRIFIIVISFTLLILSCTKIETSYNIKQGIEYLNNREYNSAIDVFNHMTEKEPENYYAWMFKGITFNEIGYTYATVENFLKDSIQYINDIKNHDSAISCFDQAILINSDLYFAWFYKGNTLLEIERYKEAIECYNEAIATNRNNYRFWAGKYYSYQRLFLKASRTNNYNPSYYKKMERCMEIINELKPRKQEDSPYKDHFGDFNRDFLDLYNSYIRSDTINNTTKLK